jgi:hypothetical protein
MNPAKKTPAKAVGRPRTEKGARPEIVKVSLHTDELNDILKVTNAPAAYLREAGLDKARKSKSNTTNKKK